MKGPAAAALIAASDAYVASDMDDVAGLYDHYHDLMTTTDALATELRAGTRPSEAKLLPSVEALHDKLVRLLDEYPFVEPKLAEDIGVDLGGILAWLGVDSTWPNAATPPTLPN